MVGPSGAGKTTLFELLQRFYDPSLGEIRFKETPIQQLEPQHLRQQMGMVQQQPTMFSSDVWHNIRYGRPDATDEEVILQPNVRMLMNSFLICLKDTRVISVSKAFVYPAAKNSALRLPERS